MVNVVVPAVVGVPARVPAAGSRVIPAGRAPALTDHANGAVPPATVSALVYGTPTSPEGGAGKARLGAAATVRVTAWVADWPVASETLTVNAYGPAAVGAPARAPVAVLRVIPAGRWPLLTDQAYAAVPPATVRMALYGTPTSPAAGAGKLRLGAAAMARVTVWVAVLAWASVTWMVKL